MTYKIVSLSECAVTVMFEQRIDPQVNGQVIALRNQLLNSPFPGFNELVVAYASLTVYFNLLEVKRNCKSGQTAFSYVEEFLSQILLNLTAEIQVEKQSEVKKIEVSYTGEDLDWVSAYTGLSVSELVDRHSSVMYRVYMMGFLPGFAYLSGLPPELSTPRRKSPRLRVKAGAVAIGGSQTGVYPMDSPGGWNVIGYTRQKLFDVHSEALTFLKAGDRVQFAAV